MVVLSDVQADNLMKALNGVAESVDTLKLRLKENLPVEEHGTLASMLNHLIIRYHECKPVPKRATQHSTEST